MLKTLDRGGGGGGGGGEAEDYTSTSAYYSFISFAFILVFLLTTRILLDHGFLRQISPWFAIFHPSYEQLTIVIPFFFR